MKPIEYVSWGVFITLLLTYWLTIPPTVSYWDCPEYVTAAWRLEIGHPPGNPMWMLVERVITMLASSGKYAALAVNLSSGLFTAFAGMLLARCIFMAMEWIIRKNRVKHPLLISSIAAITGSLAFGWCDSAWYSAVEAEVYAMSIFMTALCVWLMIKWGFCTDKAKGARYLVLISYLIGLSIGVHQLNLLVIPALVLIWARKRGYTGFWGTTAVVIASLATVGIILMGVMPGTVSLAAAIELLCVNSWHLPFLSGIALFIISGALILIFALLITHRLHLQRLHILCWMVTMLLTGYSAYVIIPLRGDIPFPSNSSRPGDPFTFATYLAREQYGATPLIYGHTPLSKPLLREEWNDDNTPIYRNYLLKSKHRVMIPKQEGMRLADNYHLLTYADSIANARAAEYAGDAYMVQGYYPEMVYTPELDMWFPRITSLNPTDFPCYADWAGMTYDNMKKVRISEAVDTAGNFTTRIGSKGKRTAPTSLRPTYAQSLRMLLTYQMGYMYFRYLLWNFSGRQNDVHSTGEVEHGNFITGITPIDNAMLGAESSLPSHLGKENKGRNRYFMFPLILGIIGIVWLSFNRGNKLHRRRSRFCNMVILTVWIMTGIAIVIYLNQSPGEPRERDYTFLGSYWAYAAWIGIGGSALMVWAGKYARIAALIPLCCVGWMFAENLDDHNRSNRYAASRIAANILNSLPYDAIIFVNGDNSTFPLWYAQEVEGIRKDVKVVNMAYLGVASYADALMRDWEGSKAIPTTLTRNSVSGGALQFVKIKPSGSDSVPDALAILEEMERSGKPIMGASKVYIRGIGEDTIHFDLRNLSKNFNTSVDFRRLILFDLIATNASSPKPRPILWINNLPPNAYAGFLKHTSPDLFALRLGTLSASQRESNYLRALQKLQAPNSLENPPYMDPTPAGQVSAHRASLLTAAEDMLKEGKVNTSLLLVNAADSLCGNDPGTFMGAVITDSIYKTRTAAPRLLRALADSLEARDKSVYSKDIARLRHRSLRMEKDNNRRNKEFSHYYKTLPPDLRLKMSK